MSLMSEVQRHLLTMDKIFFPMHHCKKKLHFHEKLTTKKYKRLTRSANGQIDSKYLEVVRASYL